MACAAALIILLWRMCRETSEIGIAGAATAACGLLLGHGYANDCVLLMPLAVGVLQKPGAALAAKLGRAATHARAYRTADFLQTAVGPGAGGRFRFCRAAGSSATTSQ